MPRPKSNEEVVRFTVYLPVRYEKLIHKYQRKVKKRTKANRVSKSEIVRRALGQYDPDQD